MFNRRVRALGRLKAGQMNKTEMAYASVLEGFKRSGEITNYWFEAIKLKVADGSCFYTPDFLVMMPDGELQLHEVKGSLAIFNDDAKVKCKVVAERYPFRLYIAYPVPKKRGGGWCVEEYPNAS